MLRAEIIARLTLLKLLAYLGADQPMLALPAQQLTQALLAVAVGRGRINQVDALFLSCIEIAIDRRLVEVDSPFAAKLPGAHADYGNVQAGGAERALFHDNDPSVVGGCG